MTQELTITMPMRARASRPARTPRFDIGAASAVGAHAANEDQFVWVNSRARATSLESEPGLEGVAAPRGCAFALVADGMGGPGHGALASAVVTRTVLNGLRSEDFDLVAPMDVFARLIGEAHLQLCEISRDRSIDEHFGTTATAVWLDGRRAVVAHVGDSRLYLLRGGRLIRLTEDQTYAQQLRATGKLGDAAPHPRLEHILWNAVTAARAPEVDLQQVETKPGDVLMLCSDGVSNPLSEPLIAEILETEGPATAAEALVVLAHEAGGSDDATAVVLHVF